VACPPHANSLQWLARGIGVVAVALCAINMFGGFAVTGRMLSMFKKKAAK
jgi:NAD(P) transhydrogenase subunit alpha